MKILIVGGVAAGASAAARIRRLDESSEIVLFEKTAHISFANCGLPYYIGGVINDRSKILVQTPESMKGRFNIDVRTNSEVVEILPEEHKVKVRSASGDYEEHYDRLILAPGARPFVPPVPGANDSRIYFVRNVHDADILKEMTLHHSNAVVIGGGFVGIETAENLINRGLSVTMVEAAPHVMVPFDSDMSPLLEEALEKNGVNLILNNGITHFEDKDGKLNIHLADGSSLQTEFCVLSIGVRPDTAWLLNSGLSMDNRGNILVDDHMRTNLPDVFAAGDAVSVTNRVSGKASAVQLAGPANREGRIAADNILGRNSHYPGNLATSVLKVFNLSAACTGLNERMLNAENIPYHTVFAHPKSHANYYPDACDMHIKLLYADSGRILGAQAIGEQGVDKFIDVIATTMHFRGTIDDLTQLELAYAPPYLSAKSPANYCGYIAQNEREGLIENVSSTRLDLLEPNDVVLDTRLPEEHNAEPIPGSLFIPLNELRERLPELESYRDKTIVVLCRAGLRGYIACRILTQHGFRAVNIKGGYLSYKAAHYKAGK